jgi:hypothetical protein
MVIDRLNLTDLQEHTLFLVRDADAINNQIYHQMAECDIMKASVVLKELKKTFYRNSMLMILTEQADERQVNRFVKVQLVRAAGIAAAPGAAGLTVFTNGHRPTNTANARQAREAMKVESPARRV